jgi:hypothetical protein
MVRAFYTAYFTGLVCLYAILSYTFGLKIALLVFGALQVSCLLLLELCSAPSKGTSSRAKWALNLLSFIRSTPQRD